MMFYKNVYIVICEVNVEATELRNIIWNFENSVNKMARVQACVAEIEGMKAENKQKEMCGSPLIYSIDDFLRVQNELIDITR